MGNIRNTPLNSEFSTISYKTILHNSTLSKTTRAACCSGQLA
jgi:hypothetical protein